MGQHTTKTRHTTLGHLLGQLLEHLVLFEQTVNIRHRQAAACCNTAFPAGSQNLGIFTLIGRHGEDDGLRVGQNLLVDLGILEVLEIIQGHQLLVRRLVKPVHQKVTLRKGLIILSRRV